MTGPASARADRFLEALEERHFRDLKFAEVTKGLRAVSAGYVERRDEGGIEKSLDGRGKRAAFALYYGAVHFLVTREIVRESGLGFGAGAGKPTILDLGCGTGVCSAAWAAESAVPTKVIGADRSSFALHEARWTWQTLQLKAETFRSIRDAFDSVSRPDGVVLGWTLNELDDTLRELVASRVAAWVARGSRLLVIEPVSKRVTPWWDSWAAHLPEGACVSSERRVRVPLSPKLALLARSAGLIAGSSIVRVLATTHSAGSTRAEP